MPVMETKDINTVLGLCLIAFSFQCGVVLAYYSCKYYQVWVSVIKTLNTKYNDGARSSLPASPAL